MPEGAQNFLEWLVESLYGFLEGLIGAHLAKQTFWFFATRVHLHPRVQLGRPDSRRRLDGLGARDGRRFPLEEPFFRGANADVNLTLAMALVFFACWIVWGLRAIGPMGFFKELFAPKGDDRGR